MNIQDILTYAIIASAAGYAIYQTVLIFFLKNKDCNCGDCSFDCTVKELDSTEKKN